MRLLHPSIEFLWATESPLQTIEAAGRVCYKSEDRITPDSAKTFCRRLIKNGHEAMIEHASMSYKVICDRGVTHEIVRHRLFSYAQESTRYCNYKGGVTFIIPSWCQLLQPAGYEDEESLINTDNSPEGLWLKAMRRAEVAYIGLLQKEWTPQQARSVLPNSLKTEIVITGNLREWRHFFKLRTTKSAHPDMQAVAGLLLKDAQQRIPLLFDSQLE